MTAITNTTMMATTGITMTAITNTILPTSASHLARLSPCCNAICTHQRPCLLLGGP
jgi:hypothetical protein